MTIEDDVREAARKCKSQKLFGEYERKQIDESLQKGIAAWAEGRPVEQILFSMLWAIGFIDGYPKQSLPQPLQLPGGLLALWYRLHEDKDHVDVRILRKAIDSGQS